MTTPLWWFVARSSGMVAWVMLTTSVIWGVVLSTKAFPSARRPAWLLDLHRWLGGLTIAFVVLHIGALIADSYTHFTLADVARGIHDKLVGRHPHVFADVHADDASAVMRNWEQIKKDEKGRESIFDGIPTSLPSLLYAHKVVRKAQTLGVDVPQTDDGPAADEIGDALLAVVAAARALDVDPEAALRAAANELRDRARLAEG